MYPQLALLLTAMASPSEVLGNTEIWLISGEQCNSCALFDEAAKKRGYGSSLAYRPGGPETTLELPIVRKDKAALAPAITAQMRGEYGPGHEGWQQMLTVALVRKGEVLSYGNIAESADINRARYSEQVMMPPAGPEPDHPALAPVSAYHDFFVANWNLEYFVDLALGRPAAAKDPLIELGRETDLPLAKRNLVLWGSAAVPMRNSLFIHERIKDIGASLAPLQGQDASTTVLYGHGSGVGANDTSYQDGKAIRFKKADINADLPASQAGFSTLFSALNRQPDARTLLVQVGHSNTFGSPLWGKLTPMTPDDFRAAVNGQDLVMISGACHSGRFANTASCGFYAAHPDVIASGCQLSAEAIRHSDDYLRHFFAALKAKGADADGNGRLSFAEAHWHAVTRVEPQNLPYTDIDALADAYFAEHPLPDSMPVAGIRALAKVATPAEQQALTRMTQALDASHKIALTDMVAENRAANARLEGAGELPSTERRVKAALATRLALPMLARRLLFKAERPQDAALAAKASCEAQAISDYL
ncbi:hypothetical protein [Gallaecimonas sp. GXIMD4217]|uniref:hypothetical protein n=1 Tax=Gallaecimonas sp. GXIMD4217 TaxID=3131927 RepID=UPI00311AFA57